MSQELRVPPVGESITEVQIGDWLKMEGQPVRKDEVLVLIESEKATIELPSPSDGVLSKVAKPRGATARVGEVIGTIEATSAGTSVGSESAPAPAPATPAASDGRREGSQEAAASAAVVMPAARRVLVEAGIDPAAVTGSGVGGRITKEDALKAVAAVRPLPGSSSSLSSAPVPPSAPVASVPVPVPAGTIGRDDEVVPMSPLRRTVARRLVEAKSAMALLTTFNEVDMTAVQALRRQFQESFTARHGIKLGFMSFFVKAVIEGLKQVPQLNAEIRDQNLVYHHYYDIGVAIGGGKGLVVPVIRNAECLSFADIEKTIADFGARARDGRIKLEELQGGTFTISNGGVYGSLLSTPIVSPPQSGILGMHTIQDRPVAIDGQVVIRPMMYLALTYDHRIVDGREAVTFLKRIKEIVETPARMLIEA